MEGQTGYLRDNRLGPHGWHGLPDHGHPANCPKALEPLRYSRHLRGKLRDNYIVLK